MSNALRCHIDTGEVTGWLENRSSEGRTVVEIAGRDGETLRFEGNTEDTLTRR